jgi:hypothetical protein
LFKVRQLVAVIVLFKQEISNKEEISKMSWTIPIPLRGSIHPKPQSADERLDQMDSALSSISEGLKEIQKHLAEGSPREEMSQKSTERPRVEPQTRISPRFDSLLRNQNYSEVLAVAHYRMLNQSLTTSADEVGRLT